MEIIDRTIYIADDGTEFFSEAECAAHETEVRGKRLVDEFFKKNEIHTRTQKITRKMVERFYTFINTPDEVADV